MSSYKFSRFWADRE